MKSRRALRDILTLLLFSGVFYAASIVMGQLESEPVEEQKDFSDARLEADELLRMKRWSQASEELRQMTLDDPYNGFAWYHLGKSYNEMRLDIYDDIEFEQKNGESESRLASLNDQVAAVNKKAIEAYEKSKEHLRYRFSSLFMLSFVYCDQGDYDQSLDYLQEFVDNEYVCYYHLDRYPFFGRSYDNGEKTRLHQFDRFWKLVQKHAEIKRQKSLR